jgi:NAD+ synthase (glutamine-hydrolysing)
MKITLAQLNYRVGDFAGNVAKIIRSIENARNEGAGLVVFAELSVCGYPPRDYLEFNDFLDQSAAAIHTIATHCRGIAAIVGSPSRNPAPRGKPLYNTAFFLYEGAVVSMAHKTLLPNYDVFDEYRYFEPNRVNYEVVEYQGHRIAMTICEDLWNLTEDPLYIRNPMDELSALNPTVVVNIAASPFHYEQPRIRQEVLSRNATRYELPLVYVNHVGGQTELLFDGGSMILNRQGATLLELPRFEESLDYFDLTAGSVPTSGIAVRAAEPVSLIHDGLVMGISDYFRKMGFSRAILGLSGGIDSAVTLALAARALGPENLRALLLPSRFSSGHSIEDARKLAENLKVSYDIVPVDTPFGSLEGLLEPWFRGLPFGLTEENLQARVRAVILMAFANKFNYILLNTSNKSEAAVGYGTLYGDMCGGLSVLGDVYKTQVYQLAGYINRNMEVIPRSTIEKPPSAELRPDQKDSDSLPEYDLLDRILHGYIEQRKSMAGLITEGFPEEVVKKVLHLVNTNEWKRHQTPPILRVSPKAFGSGRRMPIVGIPPVVRQTPPT